MKGYWLGRSNGIFATQMSPYQFDKFSISLKRRGTNSKNKQYFIPQSYCTEDYKSRNIPVEELLDNSVLDELASNVSFVQSSEDDLNKQWKKARLEKTKTETKLTNQKLQQRKKLLFEQWSMTFFEVFSDHFGKLRNMLVQLHLNDEQTNKLNECIGSCLENLQLSLDQIWNDFNKESDEEE